MPDPVVTPPAPPATPPAPWYSGVAGIDLEIVGHWANRGWDKKTAPEVALEATKAWKAAEHHVGVPADQILRVPKDAKDEAGWQNVWSRLGKPKDAKEYDFSAIKWSDGTALDDAFVENARQWAFQHNLPKEAATGMVQQFAKFLDSSEATDNTEKAAKLIEEKTALAKNWGPNDAANRFVATRAREAIQKAMNLPDDKMMEVVANLEGAYGYANVMEMFRVIGTKIGEDTFVNSTAPGAKGPMTRDQAVARKADLMSDKVWVDSYLSGDQAKKREMTALNTIIIGQAA